MGGVGRQQNQKTVAQKRAPIFPYKINHPPTLPFSPLTQSIPPPGYRQASLTNHNLHSGNGVTTAETGAARSLKPLPGAEVTE